MSTIELTNRLGIRFQFTPCEDRKTIAVLQKLGQRKAVVLDITLDELKRGWENWTVNGMYIQTAFAKLSAEQREFLMTGITPGEWDEMFKEYKS